MRTRSARVNTKLHRMKEIKKTIESLNKEYESLKEDILQFMGEEDELITEDFTVKHTQYTREIFDSKMLKESNPRMYDLYVKVQELARFTIS